MRVLGIDIGSYSIKAVELDSSFGRYEIRDYHETKIQPNEAPAEVLRRLLQSLPRKVDRAAIALKTGQVTFRNFELPAKNRKALMAAIGFELEDELPFPIDQTIYDYSLLGQAKQTSRVHVASTLQRNVAGLLHICDEAQVDPDLLTTEAWAYRSVFNRTLHEPDARPALLIQLGHSRTTVYCHHQGQPVLARDILWGGQDLTAAICKRYEIPLEQAEQTKIDNGFVLPETQRQNATPEQLEFSKTLQEPLQQLLQELKPALVSCQNLTGSPVGKVHLAGGTSLLPGLGPFLQEQLETEVVPLQALSSLSTSGVTYSEQTDASFALSTALALCMVGPDRNTSINFRKGEFAKQARSREYNTETIRRLALAIGIVSVSLFTSLMVQSFTYKTKLADVNSQLERSIRGFFGGISPSALKTYMGSTKTLVAEMEKERSKQRDLFKLLGPNPHSPIDYLKELSTQIPRDTVVDLIYFQAGAAPKAPFAPTADTSTTISFLVASQQAADKLASVMKTKQPGWQPTVEEVPGGADGKKWKVTFSGNLQEAAYGK